MHPVIFAHGLESSPKGTKATYLKERFGAVSPHLRKLDLDGQIDTLVELLKENRDTVLVGSSLGALAAMGAANRVPETIAHLLLLAPAVGMERRADTFKEAVKDRPGIFEQAIREAQNPVPKTLSCTIVHGLGDDVVPWQDVVQLALRSPSSRLLLVHDGHQLKQSADFILSAVEMAADSRDPLILR